MTQPQPQGFLAVPPSGREPYRGVLVLHTWWGLNDTIKDFCTRLANTLSALENSPCELEEY